MPDWVRIGPPYGQVNMLLRPVAWSNAGTLNQASQDVSRYGGHWGADKWAPVPSNINPGSDMASWSIQNGNADASSIWQLTGLAAQAWGIYSATSMPPSAIVARATVAMPFAATAMYVFEMAGYATFAAFPVVVEIAPVATVNITQIIASANGSVIGSAVNSAGSGGIFQTSRAYWQSGSPSTSSLARDDTFYSTFRYVTIQIRTVGSVASGAQLTIGYLNLTPLPVPWVGTSAGDSASAALAKASALVGTYFLPLGGRAIWTGRNYLSPLARYPAMATIDAQQPDGRAMEIGSTMVAGQAQWGADLVQKNYAQSLLSPGDPLAFERIPNRQITFPYIFASPSSNSHVFAAQLQTIIVPGNVVDVIGEDSASLSPPAPVRRFDIVDGRIVYNEDIRYQRAGIGRGEIQMQTLPYARSASHTFLSQAAQGGTSPTTFFVAGDVPAAAFVQVSPIGNATNGSGLAVFARGFVAAIVPGGPKGISTYFPINTVATAFGGAAASLPNGFRVAGSQIYFRTIETLGAFAAGGWIHPHQVEALSGRARVFAIVANATTATISLQLTFTAGNVSKATALSNIGYVLPLYAVASETPQLGWVDMGEVRLPLDPNSMMGTVGWEMWTRIGPSSNATAGAFDSIVMVPIADPRTWIGIVPSGRGVLGDVMVTASSVTYLESAYSGGGQGLLDYNLKYAAMDMTSLYQGRAPYLYPGANHVFVSAIGVSTNPSRPRPYSTGASSGANLAVTYQPRWFFLP